MCLAHVSPCCMAYAAAGEAEGRRWALLTSADLALSKSRSPLSMCTTNAFMPRSTCTGACDRAHVLQVLRVQSSTWLNAAAAQGLDLSGGH
jgi:hypothetical protein